MTASAPELQSRHAPGSVGELVVVALPMVVSAACETLMTFTDRLFLSRVGATEMSAAMGGGLTVFMMMTFFLGLTGYSTALVAQYLGSGRREQCARVITQALIICALAWPLLIALRPVGGWIFRVSGIADEQLGPQTTYFNILVLGVGIALARNALSCFFSGRGRTRIVMIAALVAMAVNVAANYVLIFGKFGCPAFGLRGAAYGTIIGSVCGFVVVAGAYFSPRNWVEFGVVRALRFDPVVMRKLIRFGYPAGLEFLFNLMAFNAMILLLHSKGVVAAAAVTMMVGWDMVSFVPLIGIEIGVTSLVGRYMGARRPDTAHRVTLSGLKMGWAYSAVTLVLFVGFPQQLIGVFASASASDPVIAEAIPMAVVLLRLAAFYVMVEAVFLVFSGALRGAGDTLWAMGISVCVHWTLVLGVFIAIRVFDASAQTGWTVIVLLFLLFSGTFWLRYRTGAWRNLEVVGGEETVVPHDALTETVDL